MLFRWFFPGSWMVGFFISVTLFLGCYSLEVKDAFDGKYSLLKSNKIINNYCQSCHIHRDFDPPFHVSKIRSLYKRTVFRKARECISCHYIEKDWINNQHQRKTRMPQDANRGKFKKFEKKQLRRLKKS